MRKGLKPMPATKNEAGVSFDDFIASFFVDFLSLGLLSID